MDGDGLLDNVEKIRIIFNFNSIKNNFARENHKKVEKLVKKSKTIRKTRNKHFLEKSLKKAHSNFNLL